MPLTTVIIAIVLVGAGLWAVNTYIPLAKPVKKILNLVVVACLCLWLLQVFGIIDYIRNMRVG